MILIRTAFALLAVTAFATIDSRSAAAETYRPWCVQYSGSNGDNGLTCAFTSFEQCMMTAVAPVPAARACRTRGTYGTESMAKDAAATIAGTPSGLE